MSKFKIFHLEDGNLEVTHIKTWISFTIYITDLNDPSSIYIQEGANFSSSSDLLEELKKEIDIKEKNTPNSNLESISKDDFITNLREQFRLNQEYLQREGLTSWINIPIVDLSKDENQEKGDLEIKQVKEIKKKNNLFIYIYIVVLLILWVWFLIYLSIYYYNIYQSNQKLTQESKTILLQEYDNKVKELENSVSLKEDELDKQRKKQPTLSKANSSTNEKVVFSVYLDDQDNKKILEDIQNQYYQLSLAKLEEEENKDLQYKKESNLTKWKDLDLIIPKLNLKITSYYVDWNNAETGDFLLPKIDQKLKEGVVRYPYNNIIDKWMSYIFGHSSQILSPRYKDYAYFKQLPILSLKDNFEFKAYWDNESYTYKYEVIESREIETSELLSFTKEIEQKYPWKKLVSLITCYPLNTTEKRWIVIWEQISNN